MTELIAPLRIIFMGTAELACSSLEMLVKNSSFEVVAVVTQPDKPKGRELKLQPSLVKQVALKHDRLVLQPDKARAEIFVHTLRVLRPDLIVVVAYGQILPQAILDIPKFGCINVHTSLLPKYRGAAPIQWALLEGESETGVTIMKMDAGLDTGDILAQAITPIHSIDTSQSLHDRLAQLGAELLSRTIPLLAEGKITPRKQPDGSTHARKISKEDGKLNWSQPARTLWNKVRALTPWPGTFSFHQTQNEQRLLKIWAAEVVETSGEPGVVMQADQHGIVIACKENALRVVTLQREGGKRLSARDFLLGYPIVTGDRFI